MSNRLRTYIVIVVTAVWALNFGATLAIPNYQASPEINSIFMTVMGTVLVTAPIVGSRQRRDDEQRNNGEESRSENSGERQP